MKKLLALALCLGLAMNLSGCAVGDLIDRFTDVHNSDETENSAPKTRVYMDELKGTLVDFSGNTLSIEADETTYLFDISDATLECQNGMITGDTVSIIYEGQLQEESTDTSSVRALKVVNDFHNQQSLKKQKVTGTIQNITSNTITITEESGSVVTYPITGCEEYFANGISQGNPVVLNYYGNPIELSSADRTTLNASHLKVFSISDHDPLKAPALAQMSKSGSNEGKMRATIQSLSMNTLNVLLSDSTALSLDLSQASCYFQGGAAPGAAVIISYSGSFNGTSSEGLSIENVTTEAPKKGRNLESSVSGIIIASTANTVTIQTRDGANVTCNTENVPNASTEGMEIGSAIKVTFDPAVNKSSNIYTCLKIEDA